MPTKPYELYGSPSPEQINQIDDMFDRLYRLNNVREDTQVDDQADISVLQSEVFTIQDQIASIGTWSNITYASGNFTGNGAMTWTVQSADVTNLAYTITNDTATLVFLLSATSTGGVANNALLITLPSILTATRSVLNPIWLNDNGTAGIGYCAISTGSPTTLLIQKFDTSNFSAASTNNTTVWGQITFSV